MAGGGSRPGAGRPKGRKNNATIKREEAMKAAADRLGGQFEDGLAFLVAVYNDETMPLDVRVDCAKAAAPFQRPKLSSVEATGKDGERLHPSEIEIRIVDADN
jgi:hypothetical protein